MTDVHKIQCGEIWGGISGQDVECETSGVVASLFSQPCDGGKGGDVYYFSVCDGDELTRIVIADVMGHGEKVSHTSQWLYDSIESNMNSADGSAVLNEVNRQAVDYGFDAFSTATVAAYYRADGKFYYSYAGHHPVVVFCAQQGNWKEATAREIESDELIGLPLAVDENCSYVQDGIELSAGDQILIYTDGLIEAADKHGAEFGVGNLLKVLDQNSPSSTSEIRDAMIESLTLHTGGDLSHDDITFIVAEIRES